MKIRLEDGTIAYIAGGSQTGSDIQNNQPPVEILQWGQQTGQTQQLGSTLAYSDAYGYGYSAIYFNLSSTPVAPYSNIIGGYQLNTNLNSSAPLVLTWHWGNTLGNTPYVINQGQSWSQQYQWGNSFVYLNVAPADSEPRFTIVGGFQQCSNISTTAPWVTTSSWGTQSGFYFMLGQFQSYSTEYGWGNSQLYIILQENTDSGDSAGPGETNEAAFELTEPGE